MVAHHLSKTFEKGFDSAKMMKRFSNHVQLKFIDTRNLFLLVMIKLRAFVRRFISIWLVSLAACNSKKKLLTIQFNPYSVRCARKSIKLCKLVPTNYDKSIDLGNVQSIKSTNIKDVRRRNKKKKKKDRIN